MPILHVVSELDILASAGLLASALASQPIRPILDFWWSFWGAKFPKM